MTKERKFAKCEKCGSTWPALTTVDAYKNYLQVAIIHPGERCTNFEEEKGSE